MSYLVLARKYRPMSFEAVVAQEHVTRTLRNALNSGRVGSGYLFTGPRGTGKTTVARILAKAANCEKGANSEPCNECDTCKEITTGSSLDVLEIDAASNTGVDDIRALRENVRYMPTRGRKRIYIIDEVHRLSGSAFDALLKTLEEPPEHVMFIMATTEPLKVPETILSRTQRFDFRRVSSEDLSQHLKKIAGLEGITIDDPALRLLARKANGSVRDSLSLMDQIIAFAGEKVTEDDVVKGLGLVDRAFLFSFVEAAASKDRAKTLRQIHVLFESGVEAADFVVELLDHLRCLMIIQSVPESSDLLGLSADEMEAYLKQSEYFSIGDVLRLIKILADLNEDLKTDLDERLLLETAAVKMADMETTVRFEEILKQLQVNAQPVETGEESKESSDLFGSSASESKKKTATVAEAPPPAISVESGVQPSLPQIESEWEGFMNQLRRSNRMLSSLMNMGKIKSIKENRIEMLFEAAGRDNVEVLRKQINLNLIRDLLRKHYKTNLDISFAVDGSHPPRGGDQSERQKRAKVDPKELLEKSPRLKELIERVGGEVIGIKNVED